MEKIWERALLVVNQPVTLIWDQTPHVVKQVITLMIYEVITASETWAKPNLRSSFANSQSGYTNPRSDYPNSETWAKPNLKNSLVSAMRKVISSIQKEYIDEEREGF